MTARFDTKGVSESVVLTFDFSPDLSSETLVVISSVTVTVSYGTDASPSAILTGSPEFDLTRTKVLVPVKAGLNKTDYDIQVIVTTTNPNKILSLSGILPVRSG